MPLHTKFNCVFWVKTIKPKLITGFGFIVFYVIRCIFTLQVKQAPPEPVSQAVKAGHPVMDPL